MTFSVTWKSQETDDVCMDSEALVHNNVQRPVIPTHCTFCDAYYCSDWKSRLCRKMFLNIMDNLLLKDNPGAQLGIPLTLLSAMRTLGINDSFRQFCI